MGNLFFAGPRMKGNEHKTCNKNEGEHRRGKKRKQRQRQKMHTYVRRTRTQNTARHDIPRSRRSAARSTLSRPSSIPSGTPAATATRSRTASPGGPVHASGASGQALVSTSRSKPIQKTNLNKHKESRKKIKTTSRPEQKKVHVVYQVPFVRPQPPSHIYSFA